MARVIRSKGGLDDLEAFADKLEAACMQTLSEGIMTKDLVGLVEPGFPATAVTSAAFMDAIAERLSNKLA